MSPIVSPLVCVVIAKLYFESFLPRCRTFLPDFAFPVLVSSSLLNHRDEMHLLLS